MDEAIISDFVGGYRDMVSLNYYLIYENFLVLKPAYPDHKLPKYSKSLSLKQTSAAHDENWNKLVCP